jgi:hypothetical protein
MNSMLIFSISCTILIISITMLIIMNLEMFMKSMNNFKYNSNIGVKEELTIDTGKSLFYPTNSINPPKSETKQTIIPIGEIMRNVVSEDNGIALNIQYTKLDKETTELMKDVQDIMTSMHMYGCKKISNVEEIIKFIPMTEKCNDIFKDEKFIKTLEMSDIPKSTQEQIKLLIIKLRKISCNGDKFNRDKFITLLKNILNSLCNVKNFEKK